MNLNLNCSGQAVTERLSPWNALKRRALCLFLIFTALLGFVAAGSAAQPSVLGMRTDDDRQVSWVLTADVVRADDVGKIVEAEGNVVLRRGEEFLKADFVRYFASTNWIYLKNHVEISFANQTEIVAEEAEFDLRSRTGWMKRGQIFVSNPHMYYTGERIENYWGDIYSFNDATVSSCFGDTPAWSMSAQEAVVEIDGYARLSWPAVRVMDQGVMAMPFFIIPMKEKRQSGFLLPDYGYSSRDGLYYSQPFFWAMDESQDLTLSETFMSHRGFMHGVEYRANPRSDQLVWGRFEYLYDKQIVTNDANDPINDRDGLIRDNYQRFWVRGMADGYFEDPRWRFKVDLDYVSDQNYLREFYRGLGGFEDTRNTLFNWFGRDLNERDAKRTSQAQILRDWERVSMALSARYDQDPSLEHGNRPYSSSTTPQRLPEVNLYLDKGRIFSELPLEIEASAQAVRFQRETGSTGMRYDLYPKITLPLVSRYGSVLISGGLHQTSYVTDRTEAIASDSGDNTGDSRTLPDATIAAMTELAAVYPLDSAPLKEDMDSIGQSRWNAIQHVVQPRVTYQLTENVDQTDNPFYDADDRIGPRNDLTYSITNILTRRREMVSLTTAEDGTQAAALAEDYLEFLRLALSQSYNIREAHRTDQLTRYERRPFGDIRAELTVRPVNYLRVRAKSYWSPYEEDFTLHDISLGFSDSYWGTLSFGYNYRAKIQEYDRRRARAVESLYISGMLNVWGPWSIGGVYRADLHANQDVERAIQVIYKHQCFTLYGEYTKDYDDERYSISIELLGLTDQ